MSRRIRAVEHRCAAGLSGTQPSLQDQIVLNNTTGLPTCLHQKKPDLVPKSQKKPDSSFDANTHKTCTTTNKIDIKTRRNHRYYTSPIFRSIFFWRNCNFGHLFFINNADHFQGNSKIFAIFCALCMVIDPRRKRFAMNMQLRQCFARAKLIRLKISFSYFQKSQRCSKKARISKYGFKKVKLATLLHKN